LLKLSPPAWLGVEFDDHLDCHCICCFPGCLQAN
jgi:hypothetical protein